jgi:transposase
MQTMSDPDIGVWFLDEVLFHLHGSSCRMWTSPENKQPQMLFHPTRKSIDFFGAGRPWDGRFVFMPCMTMFNAETFSDFLYHLSWCSPGRRMVLILDNARYHHANMLDQWKRSNLEIELAYLLQYSPDLNPIERVWKLTRKESTHNRYFNDLEGLKMAVIHRFARWTDTGEVLRRLCAVN